MELQKFLNGPVTNIKLINTSFIIKVLRNLDIL